MPQDDRNRRSSIIFFISVDVLYIVNYRSYIDFYYVGRQVENNENQEINLHLDCETCLN